MSGVGGSRERGAFVEAVSLSEKTGQNEKIEVRRLPSRFHSIIGI